MGNIFAVAQSGTRDFVKRMAIKTIRLNFARQKTFIEILIGGARLVTGLICATIIRICRPGNRDAVCFICKELLRAMNGAIHAPAHKEERTRAGKLAVFIGVASAPALER